MSEDVTKPEAGVSSDGTNGPVPLPEDFQPKELQPTVRSDDQQEVTMTRGQLRGILADMQQEVRDEFATTISQQDEKIELLTEAADTKRMFQAKSRRKGAVTRTLRLSLYDGKVIVGWRMLKDIVRKNAMNNAWVEQQIVEVVLEDDSKVEFPSYLQFDDAKRADQKMVQILGKEEMQDGSGQVIYRVSHPTKKGEEIRISSPFVN